MNPAAAAILEGMPDPRDLRRAERDGMTFICAGSALLACYPSGDAGMRNVAVAVLRQLGFGGRAVAAVMGLTENYVATLHNRALREGTRRAGARAGTARQAGRARLGAGGPVAGGGGFGQRDRPPAGGRPVHGVPPPGPGRRAGAAARRRAGGRGGPEQDGEPGPQAGEPGPGGPAGPGPGDEPAAPGPGPEASPAVPEPAPAPAGDLVPAGGRQPSPGAGLARVAGGVLPSRYAGAMLVHAYLDRIGAEAILAAALPPALARPRYDDLGLLTATSLAFALGASSAEGTKHLIPAQAGILAGIGRLPDPRTLRPRLAAIADGVRPAGPAAAAGRGDAGRRPPACTCTTSMTTSSPTRAPSRCPKGWNTKRRHAQPGRADTMVTDYHGRAVCFADRRAVRAVRHPARRAGPAAPGARRAGEDPARLRPRRLLPGRLPRHPRRPRHWVTWRRAPLAPVTAAPRRYWAARGDGKPAEVLALADETVQIKDYGQARQITLFEDGAPVLQMLTSDLAAPAAALLSWLKLPVADRELVQVPGGQLRHPLDVRLPRQHRRRTPPDRQPRAQGRARPAARGRGRRWPPPSASLAALLARPGRSPAAAKNKAIPAAEKKITTAREAVAAAKAARKKIPAKLPASQIDPRRPESHAGARGRRCLQMVLRLLAAQRRALARQPAQRLPARRRRVPGHHPPDHAPRPRRHHHLHAPRDHRRPSTRPAAPRDRPRPRPCSSTRSTPAPPRMPGDTRPITYQLAAHPRI